MDSTEPRKPGLVNRELGVNIPVSYGTANAIESSLGLLEGQSPEDPPINTVESLWINVRTLFRNAMSSTESDSSRLILPEEMAETLMAEMTIINSVVNDKTKGMVNVVFYICTHSSITRKFPNASYRNSNQNTELQRNTYIVEQQALKELLDSGAVIDLRKFDLEFGDSSKSAFIVTHQPIDLLNQYRFKKLLLLETHTGAIKPRSRWYTKLHGGKDLVNIPFDRMTLQLFGDSNMFSPLNIKVRKHTVELAKANAWTYMTTRDMILSCIKKTRDPVYEALITKLY